MEKYIGEFLNGFLIKSVVRENKNGKNRSYFLVECFCGKEKKVATDRLKRNEFIGCGCKDPRKTHGRSKTRLYKIWQDMKQRCYNEKLPCYHRYGGRGIKIHEIWKTSFEEFEMWSFSNGYSDSLTIDRIDVDGNYEPDNCRWATSKEQFLNKDWDHYSKKMRKEIVQIDPNTLKVIGCFKGIYDTQEKMNIRNISTAIKLKQKAGGYYWDYKKDKKIGDSFIL